MTKKIFDIIPPGQGDKDNVRTSIKDKIKETIIAQKPAEPEVKAEPVSSELKVVRPKKGGFKVSLLIWPILLVAIGFSFQLSKAEILIWPKTEEVSLQADVVADVEADEVDAVYKSIPASVFESQKVLYEEFTSSGKTLKKAEGTIRLYNEYSTQPEAWLAGTRFVSSDGYLFKSKDKINVPGAEIKDGKLVARYVDVPVIAAEAGTEYNIEPTHFSIYVFRGTPRYTKFYGESLQSMEGGGQSPEVTKKDLEDAEKALVEKAESACEQELKAKIPGGSVFVEDVLKTDILEKFSLAKAGDALEKFDFRVKSACQTILFKKNDMDDYVEKTILSQSDEGSLVYEKSLVVNYTADTIDFESGKVNLSLDVSGRVYAGINFAALKKELTGKSLNGTELFLASQPEISEVKVEFWPFWVKNVPKDIEKVSIEYRFEGK